MKHRFNLTGQLFGRLIAIRPFDRVHWECLCQCGNRHYPQGSNLRTGRTKSCGCLSAGEYPEYDPFGEWATLVSNSATYGTLNAIGVQPSQLPRPSQRTIPKRKPDMEHIKRLVFELTQAVNQWQ